MHKRIKCSKCGREMSLTELVTYFEIFLLKKTLQAGVVQALIKAIKNYICVPGRGIVDDRMATYANYFKIRCSDCDVIGSWKPISECMRKEKSENKDSITV
jgi:hypothetical protein